MDYQKRQRKEANEPKEMLTKGMPESHGRRKKPDGTKGGKKNRNSEPRIAASKEHRGRGPIGILHRIQDWNKRLGVEVSNFLGAKEHALWGFSTRAAYLLHPLPTRYSPITVDLAWWPKRPAERDPRSDWWEAGKIITPLPLQAYWLIPEPRDEWDLKNDAIEDWEWWDKR